MSTSLALQLYPASSGFSRPDDTGEKLLSPVSSGLEKPLLAGYYRLDRQWSILLDQTVSQVNRRDGWEGDYLREAINQETAVIWGMVAWVAGTIKGRVRKVQKGKGGGSSCHKYLCFCMLPTRFPNVKSTVTTWPSTFNFFVYRDVNNVLEKGITDSWDQIPQKSKHHPP